MDSISKMEALLKVVEKDYTTFMTRNFPVWAWGKHPEAIAEMNSVIRETREDVKLLQKLLNDARNNLESYNYFMEKGDETIAQKRLESALTNMSAAIVGSLALDEMPGRIDAAARIVKKEVDDTTRSGATVTAGVLSIIVGVGALSICSELIGAVVSSTLIETAGAGAVSSAAATVTFDAVSTGTVSGSHILASAGIGMVLGPVAEGIGPVRSALGAVGGKTVAEFVPEVVHMAKIGKPIIADFFKGEVRHDQE